MTENENSFAVIGKAIEVHKTLGPGLLENIYQSALEFELRDSGLMVASEVRIPILYKGQVLPGNYRIDILIENQVVIEI